MGQVRSYRAVGAFMVGAGLALLALGFSRVTAPDNFRLLGAVLAFFGVVLLAQAKRRSP